MKRLKLLLLTCLVLSFSQPASTQTSISQASPRRIAAAEQEVRQFYEAYAEDLRQHRREAVADRYDRRGVYMMGNGEKNLTTFEAVRARYLDKWKGPKSFQWHDLSFEILAPDIAVVLGRFTWETVDAKTFNYSYTGVLLKRDGRWRIRVEDESGAK